VPRRSKSTNNPRSSSAGSHNYPFEVLDRHIEAIKRLCGANGDAVVAPDHIVVVCRRGNDSQVSLQVRSRWCGGAAFSTPRVCIEAMNSPVLMLKLAPIPRGLCRC